MKYYLTVLFGLFLSVPMLHAQSVQKVQVFEYRGAEPKVPLEGVTIAVQNAPQMQSDQQGEMQLQFRTQKRGEKVQVRRIEKTGYEIFNNDALQQWNISEERPFRVVMCRTEFLKSLREQYMQNASNSYRQQFDNDRKALDNERKEKELSKEVYEQRLMELQMFYNQQFSQLSQYVEQFVRLDLNELDEQQRSLVLLVNEGRFDEAIAAFEKADFIGQLAQQIKDIQKIDQTQKQLQEELMRLYKERLDLLHVIYRQASLYQLAGGRANYAKVNNLLKQTADADSTYFDANWLYVFFARQQNMVDEVEEYTLRCIRHTAQEHVLRHISCYTSLSDTYNSIGEFEKAQYYRGKALVITEEAYNKSKDNPYLKEKYATLSLVEASDLARQGKAEEGLRRIADVEDILKALFQESQYAKTRYNMAEMLNCKATMLHMLNPKDPTVLALSDSALNYLRDYYMNDNQLMQLYGALLNDRIGYIEDNPALKEQAAQENYDFTKKLYSLNASGTDLAYLEASLQLAEVYLKGNKVDSASPLIEQARTLLADAEKKYKKAFHNYRTWTIYVETLFGKAMNDANIHEKAQQGLEEFNLMDANEQKTNEHWRHFLEAK